MVSSRKSRLNASTSLLLIAILIFALTFSSSSIFRVIPAADAFSVPFHKEITQNVLGFLKQPILDKIESGHTTADWFHPVASEYHFDGCNFQGATQHINTLYSKLATELNPSTFGQILHAAMDFYAHSNWVEMGKSELIDDGPSEWTVLQPFELVKGVYVIQGEEKDIPAGFKLSRAPGEKIVKVTAPDGKEYPGLITGTVPYWADDCPDNIALGHGFVLEGLNKDDPGTDVGIAGRVKTDRPHLKAVELATAQTLHEWCRLVNLVGEEGKQKLFDLWVADKAAAEQTACPPPEWKGTYEDINENEADIDRSDLGYSASAPDTLATRKFTNDGEFFFNILNDYSVSGKGHGKVQFDEQSRYEWTESFSESEYHGNGNITFSVGGNYDPKSGKIRLKFFDISNYHVSFDGRESSGPEGPIIVHNEGDVKGSVGFAFYSGKGICITPMDLWLITPCEEYEFEMDLKDGATIEAGQRLPSTTNQSGPENLPLTDEFLDLNDFVEEPICKEAYQGYAEWSNCYRLPPPGTRGIIPSGEPFPGYTSFLQSKITIQSSKSDPTS